jgi:hypothetical protein
MINLEHIPATDKDVRKFGIMFSIIFLLLIAYSLYKGSELWKWFAGGSAFFLFTGLFLRKILRPIYIGWMKFALVLAWVNTRIILGLAYFGVFSPASLIMKLFRKDTMAMRIDKNARTYWVKREPAPIDQKRYEQIF